MDAVERALRLQRRAAEAVPALRRGGVQRLREVGRVDGALLLDLEQLAHVPVVRVMREPTLRGGHLPDALRRIERAEGGLGEPAVEIGPGAPVALVCGDLRPRRRPGIALLRDPAAGEGDAHLAAAVFAASDEQVLGVAVVVLAAHVHALLRVVQVEPLHVQELGIGHFEPVPGPKSLHAEPRPECVRPGEPVVGRVAQFNAPQCRDAHRVHQRRAGHVRDLEPEPRPCLPRPQRHLALDAQAVRPLPDHARRRDSVARLRRDLRRAAGEDGLGAMLPELPRLEAGAILLDDLEPRPAHGVRARLQGDDLARLHIEFNATQAVVQRDPVGRGVREGNGGVGGEREEE